MVLVPNQRQIVGVTGYHASGTNEFAAFLEQRGFRIKFPGQDLEVTIHDAWGPTLYAQDHENIEVLRYNETALNAAGMVWSHVDARLVTRLPVVKPFLDMFPADVPIVISDPRLCQLWRAWHKHVTHWVYLRRNPDDMARAMVERHGVDPAHWKAQEGLYRQAFQPILQGTGSLELNYQDFVDRPQEQYKALRQFGIKL